MTNHSLNGAREQLVRQLVYFDEEKSGFMDLYYPQHGTERSKLDSTLTRYTASLEKCLQQLNEADLHSIALIGSRVKIAYEDDGAEEAYTIVHPSKADPDRGKISFLSPVGERLLLGHKDGRYSINSPSGSYEIRIIDVQYVNQGEI